MKDNKNKSFIFGLSIIIFVLFVLALYGFYEKNRKLQLYEDFRANKKLLCGKDIVQKSRGWTIRNNRFFTNGNKIKTIVFCESVD